MATVTGMTADAMEEIKNTTVVNGDIDGSGHLILLQFDGTPIDAGSIRGSFDAATDTAAGIVELATVLEATTGTDTTRAVTPEGLAAAVSGGIPDASDTVKGKVELATNAEAITGTDSVRAVTPANLAAAVTTHVAAASATVSGKVELATPAEATTGTDTVRAVTPEGLKTVADTKANLASPTFTGTVSATNLTVTGRHMINSDTITISSNHAATDADLGNFFKIAANANFTLDNPTNPTTAQRITWRIKQDGTGSRIITYDTKFRFGADITGAVLSTGANKVDYIGAIYDSTDDKWDVVSFVKGY